MEFFAKATTWLSEKAGVGAVDWAALASRNQDSVLSTAYMDQYLLPAFNKCARVIDTLDIQHGTTTEVLLNYAHMRDKLSDEADQVLQVIGTSVQLLNPVLAPTVAWSAYNNLIWHIWAMAMTGAEMHTTAQIHKSGVPEADIAYHASLCTMMFNLIVRLDEFGLLKPLKKSTTNGLGAVPVAIIIVLGAVAIAALAWAIVAIFEVSQRNAVVEAACKRAAESGDPAAIVNCQKLFSTPEGNIAASVPDAIGKVVEKVAIAAMVGAGLYVLVLFGPGIATKVKQSVAAWKAA